VETKLVRRVSVIVGMAVLSSSEDAQWVRKNRPNVIIPNDIVTRLSNAKDPEKEGIEICIEQINALKTIPGVSGAHIIASEKLINISTAIKNANI
jgi:5,10-methylenetetrahydrofolate reductase